VQNLTPLEIPKAARWSAEQEQLVASHILAAELVATNALQDVTAACDILNRTTRRAERTRAGQVDRLEEATRKVREMAREDPTLRKTARIVSGCWAEAERLRWALAMSGKRIAHGEARKLCGPFMDEADLVQEGYIGLLRAAKRFDPDRAIRFSTYARWWVRAQMTRAIDHTGRPIRLPGCAVEQTRNLRKAKKTFEDLGVEFTISDLAGEVGIDEKRASFLLSQGKTVSLDEPVEDGPRQRSLENFLADDDADHPEESAINDQEIIRMMEGFHGVLTERHRHVLRRRFGLDDDQYRTLSEVGKGMNLSRERVRQIEREALARLRERAQIRDVA
jgi:RNA polymerase nonessential primary-like sigma factor